MEAPTTKFFSAGYCPKVTPALSGFDEPSLSGFSPMYLETRCGLCHFSNLGDDADLYRFPF